LPRPLVPSGAHAMIDEEAGDDIVPSAIFREKLEVGGGRTRGKVLHALLQNLPAFEPAERRAAAMRYLSRSLPHWSEERQAELADRVLAILEDPRLARLHGPESRAEVSIMGTIRLGGTERAVSGRVDRMGIADGRVFVLDYKTTMVPPESEEEIPFLHRAQLAIYREVLKPLFPGKEIECLLLYTEGPHLYSIPSGELEKALLAISDQSSTH
jgi:ATP-dependent helicase/nuclease subunit A